MADFDFLHDDIVCNILARLPAKPLLRFRCVSIHWNRMLREESFMKLRSRKTIFLPLTKILRLIDLNANIIVGCSYPVDLFKGNAKRHRVVGTFNGIVFLMYHFELILYNPFTCVYKKLGPLPTLNYDCGFGFGYGYGDERDLKFVMLRRFSKYCDVYKFKEGSWSKIEFNVGFYVKFQSYVGTYTNGFLYWIASGRNVLIVLDVKHMIFSTMNLPFKNGSLLGTMNRIGGCLCALNRGVMWVMKEHNQWTKIYSFKLPSYTPLCILDSGKILLVNSSPSRDLIIYDPTKSSYRTLNMSLEGEYFCKMHVLEYVESLVSPLDIMSVTC